MRKKSGPKRKILEDLETRLTRVEELLHEKNTPHMLPTASSHSPKDQPNMPVSEHFSIPSSKTSRLDYSIFSPMKPYASGTEASQASHTLLPGVPGNSSNCQSSSIGLAFTEQLPSEDIICAL
ncbi:hypothetical protein N7451_005632 [Penicillium sp. IBT 35674x]|nr:hypothetical protein N7451_005632 [Penicillium sp. IBT 35674x]